MEKVKVWLFETILKRAIPRAVAGLVGLLASKGILTLLAGYGVTIDPIKFQAEITVLALMGADIVLRYVKNALFKKGDSK